MMQILGVLGAPRILQNPFVPCGFAVGAHAIFEAVLEWGPRGAGPMMHGQAGLAAVAPPPVELKL